VVNHNKAALTLFFSSSTRFIVFDEHARIITEHQTEFEQILPHAGWHEHDPEALVDAMRECINRAMYKLEFLGWHKDSVKGIGMSWAEAT
jgi:glycerol kinase